MAAEVASPFTDEQLHGEEVSKKDIATFLQASASEQFLLDHKLKGAIKNVVKTKTKEQMIEDYKQLFATKSFKRDGEAPVSPTEKVAKDPGKGSAAEAKDVKKITEKTKKLEVKEAEPVKYTKKILKAGDKATFPQKGDEVECYYTGKLADGKVFDTNVEDAAAKKGKKNQPLKFKIGAGKVIKGNAPAAVSRSLGMSKAIEDDRSNVSKDESEDHQIYQYETYVLSSSSCKVSGQTKSVAVAYGHRSRTSATPTKAQAEASGGDCWTITRHNGNVSGASAKGPNSHASSTAVDDSKSACVMM